MAGCFQSMARRQRPLPIASGAAVNTMDLPELLQHVPPLLEACIDRQIPALRRLRLVNKECSRIALLGLKVYRLSLHGSDGDTNVNGSVLLKTTQLMTLEVRLSLSTLSSSAILVKAFVDNVGRALSSVTQLKLNLFECEAGVRLVPSTVIDDVIQLLARACPVLRSFVMEGRLLPSSLHALGESCPLLTAVTFDHNDTDLSYLQALLLAQPTLLPNITDLTLQGQLFQKCKLPDMSKLGSLLVLHMHSHVFRSEAEWGLLPPKLKSLKCRDIDVGPPTAAQSRPCLKFLASLTTDDWKITLHELAQLVSAAPALQALQIGYAGWASAVMCNLDETTAADFSVLHQRQDLISGMKTTFTFPRYASLTEEAFRTVLAGLPCMTGVTACKMEVYDAFLQHSLIRAFGAVFPDLNKIVLSMCQTLGDNDLATLAACTKLSRLTLKRCNGFSPKGLFALWVHLPNLSHVCCDDCSQLQSWHVKDIPRQLQRPGTTIYVTPMQHRPSEWI